MVTMKFSFLTSITKGSTLLLNYEAIEILFQIPDFAFHLQIQALVYEACGLNNRLSLGLPNFQITYLEVQQALSKA